MGLRCNGMIWTQYSFFFFKLMRVSRILWAPKYSYSVRKLSLISSFHKYQTLLHMTLVSPYIIEFQFMMSALWWLIFIIRLIYKSIFSVGGAWAPNLPIVKDMLPKTRPCINLKCCLFILRSHIRVLHLDAMCTIS